MFGFGRKKVAKTPVVVRPVNPDLQKERQNCTFDVKELTYFLDGGKENHEQRKDKEEFYLSDPALQSTKPIEYMSHEEKYREYLKKSKAIVQKMRKLNQDPNDYHAYRKNLGSGLGLAMFPEGNAIALHHVMFIPTILGQADEEQKKYWLPRAREMKFIGTYAQTELGHGTFIRGLETTATYIPETQQFEMHSPTLSAYKWWPGGLGQTANYAVVMAQLYTKGKCHGLHLFIVQLRDEVTHKPMPGITIGEIGVKLGINGTNNGFLGFNKVRIPRTYMLMKNSKVALDGTYTKTKSGQNSKLVYGSMIYVRVNIVEDMSFYTAKVATIALRYSAVRHQSEMKPGEPEPQILDYQTQQYKLLPIVAFSYAFKFSASWLKNIYGNVMAGIEQGDLAQLPELHAMACCLKAVCTADAARSVEIARLSCGGHGYMACSNLPGTYGLVTAANTYEGENTVMLLQTARALMKAWSKVQAGEQLTPTLAYLSEEVENMKPWSNSLEGLVHAFKYVSAAKVAKCGAKMQQSITSGMAPEQAWNSVSVQLVDAAEAHCRAFLVEHYVEALHTSMNELSAPLKVVMQQLCELYCVYWVLQRPGDFLMYTTMKTGDVAILEEWQSKLLAQLRPNAIGLVDAFDFRDEVLGSALGAFDGQVYERLLESAMQSPLNAKPVHESFHESIVPLVKSKY